MYSVFIFQNPVCETKALKILISASSVLVISLAPYSLVSLLYFTIVLTIELCNFKCVLLKLGHAVA
jgi:hypothetical protein